MGPLFYCLIFLENNNLDFLKEKNGKYLEKQMINDKVKIYIFNSLYIRTAPFNQMINSF